MSLSPSLVGIRETENAIFSDFERSLFLDLKILKYSSFTKALRAVQKIHGYIPVPSPAYY